MTSFEPVRAVLRGLEVLRVLNEGGPMTATAISNGTDLPQPTIIRILETLMAAGYVYKTEEANIYGVTARTLSLSSGFDANSRIVQLSQHLIEDLRAEIGWPTNLAVFVDADAAMSIVYTNRKAYGMSMPGRLGARLPLLVTGVGTAYLAFLDPDARAAVLQRLRTSKSAWDSDRAYWKNLDERLELVRANGYALAHEAYLEDVYGSKIWSLAVPLSVNGKVTAALSTMVLHNAGPQHKLLKQLLPSLRRTAEQITSKLVADAVGPGPLVNAGDPD